MRSSTRLLLALSLTIVALGLLGWVVSSVGELHDRLARVSIPLATGLLGVAIAAVAGCGLVAARMFWQLGRSPGKPVQAPEDVIRAAEIQAEKAGHVIDQVKEPAARERLDGELAELRSDRQRKRFHVVVFGTISAGKTSLINALLGRAVGKTEAVGGTTRHGEQFTHTVEGVEGTLILTDTPGLSEIGSDGSMREAEARDLAARADLLLFVVDHDLVRSEFDPLQALAQQGKRAIVLLNKMDRFPDDARAQVLARLRDRLRGSVDARDIVAISAAPPSEIVRVRNGDGSSETVIETPPPQLEGLWDRIAAILDREGESLRAANLLLRAHLISKAAQGQLSRERRERAETVIDRFQWITAGTVFANPVPALDLMAAGAVQFQMITEIAAVYQVPITASHVRTIGTQMVQLLLKLGLVEAASSLLAGVFKSSLVGYAAGGAVQATTMAYLTHISGHAFADYFQAGQSWGDGGMQAALVRQFDLNSRAEFLQEFARQALDRVVRKVGGSKSA